MCYSFPMIVGIDFHGTITANPKLFRLLGGVLVGAGHQVHIISACKMNNVHSVRGAIVKSKVPHTSIEIIPFNDYSDIPLLKLAACKRLGVRLMFDDMPEVCKLLASESILTCQVA